MSTQRDEKNPRSPMTYEELSECDTVKTLWRQSNLTQAQFAAQLGFSRSQLSKIIRKERPCGPKVRAAIHQYRRLHQEAFTPPPCEDVIESVVQDLLYHRFHPALGEEAKPLANQLARSIYHMLLNEHAAPLLREETGEAYTSYLQLLLGHLRLLDLESEEMVSKICSGYRLDSNDVLHSNWREAMIRVGSAPAAEETVDADQLSFDFLL